MESSFVLQLVGLLVPVLTAFIGLRQYVNKRINALEKQVERLTAENAELRRDNEQMAVRLTSLAKEHAELQHRYEESLKKQAGFRDRF